MPEDDNTRKLAPPRSSKLKHKFARPVGALKIGKSQLDWFKLKSQHDTLVADPQPMKLVTADELASHNTPQNAWTCINNKVYELTPYMEYHPGGISTLMEAAGNDSTQLFMQYHSWVNYEVILDKSFVGIMAEKPHCI